MGLGQKPLHTRELEGARSSQRNPGVLTTNPRLCPPGSDRLKMWVMPLMATRQALPQHAPPPTHSFTFPRSLPHSHFSIFTATFRTASSLPRPKAVASTTFPKAPAPRVLPATHTDSLDPWEPMGPLSRGPQAPQSPCCPVIRGPGGLRSHLTKLQVVSGELPLLIVGQLSGINESIVVALIALNDLPAHSVLGLLQRDREEACVSWAWLVDLGSQSRLPRAGGVDSPKALGRRRWDMA